MMGTEWLTKRNQIVTRAFRLLCLVLFGVGMAIAAVTTARAQSETATISGLVTDESGAVMPGVGVKLQSVERGTIQAATTNNAGIYVFPSVLPGQYQIRVNKSGFKQVDFLGLIANVQDHIEQNFRLQVGSVSESVTVNASDLHINTTDAAVSTVIDRQFVESLPLNGRSFNTLLQLTPGVVIAPASSNSPGQFSIAGQRTDANSFTIDGVSANFGVLPTTGQSQSGTGTVPAFSAQGGTSSLVSVDALQEFRIETSSFAPEFGRTPGGQVILTTRSGTNDFHGGIFDYFRNTVMDANDWFANQAGLPRAAEHHNDFGGFLGGPVWKQKTFFFVSYEGARLTLPQTAVQQVPSAFARTQASTLAPATAPFLNAYPQPNGQPISPTAYVAPFTGGFSNHATLDAGSIRVDHRFNDRFSIFGRYNNAPSYISARGGTGILISFSPSMTQNSSVDTQTLTLGLNMSLSSRTSNIVRGNYSTQRAGFVNSMDSFGGAVPLDPSLLLGSLPISNNFATFSPLGQGVRTYSMGPSGNNRTKQLNLVDALNIVVGSHQFMFGGDYRAIWFEQPPPLHASAALVFDLQSFVTPPTAGQVFLTASNQKLGRILSQSLSLYAQDVWKINRRLTLTYGLRWELAPAPSALGSTTLTSWTNTSNPANIALAPRGTPLWGTTHGNFAPRLGAAYSLSQRGDFVLRAGVGVFYDLGLGQSAILVSGFPNTVFTPNFGVSLPINDLTPFLPPPATLNPPFPPIGVYAFAHDLKLPRSYQWNVALEKSFSDKHSISATYIGQAGRDLLRQTALFQPNASFLGELLLDVNDSRSNYNALQLQYRKPLSGHIQAILNYTWSHSLDNASSDVVAGFSNTVISSANDYASSDFDVRHSFSGALTFSPPALARAGLLSYVSKDWSFDGVVVARTGFPFNANLTSVSLDPGGVANTRPDRVSGQPIYFSGAQCASELQALGALMPGQSCPGGKGLNPNAFAMPSTVRQGTEGRNDIPGFGLTQVDLSVGRKFSITERANLQLRADAFNMFNHPNFTNPDGGMGQNSSGVLVFATGGVSRNMLNQGLGGLNPLFQEGGPRSFQLSLKLSF